MAAFPGTELGEIRSTGPVVELPSIPDEGEAEED